MNHCTLRSLRFALPWGTIRAVLYAAVLAAASSGHAQTSSLDSEPVALPPLVVSSKEIPWLYARVGNIEILSRCSTFATQQFIKKIYRAYQTFDGLIPEDFQAKQSVPIAYILYGSDMTVALPQEMLAWMKKNADHRVITLPNLMLFDRDAMETIALNEVSDMPLQLAPECLRLLIGRRAPAPPPWFIAGAIGILHQATYDDDEIEIATQTWNPSSDAKSIVRDPEFPRRLIPMSQLFVSRQPESPQGDPEFIDAWQSEAALLFRWAFDPKFPDRKPKLWKFAAAASASPPATEAMFEQCFGFGYAEMLDRLSDALPSALDETLRVKTAHFVSMPNFEVRRASSTEVGRIKGNWERLAARNVKARLPELASQYFARARETLTAAHDRDPHDPDLSAVMGLCECDAGNDPLARGFLEAALRGKVAHPRVYFELARLRYAEAKAAPAGTDGRLSADQAATIVAPLENSRQQAPLPETYGLLGDVWLQCAATIPPEQLEALAEGVRLFPLNLNLVYLTSLVESKHDLKTDAVTLAEQGLRNAPDDATRQRFAKLKKAIETSELR